MSYRLEVTPERRRYHDVRCDDCGRALELVGEPDADGAWSCLQPDEGLELHVVGGYGMFIDLLSERAPAIVLCRDCGVRACETFPWLKQAVMPRVNASIGHECPLAGGFVWRSYWSCACSRKEQERHEERMRAYKERQLEEHGHHLFLAKPLRSPDGPVASGVCEICELSVNDDIHAVDDLDAYASRGASDG